ncbi:putative ubiquitin carboxyl-terminal hydrolase FAF [Glarea lozoyensis 74030]|uniref:Putative ubiquitin carboxyl-terminal hydrolase FAF n=1 Tax=Glarea lozoyensis (strain ATCC 74030 / MF5533) TaxID=1104152 RepID=H0EJ89_GLAL7|nr:putative ubiquitin carboxyl-terminal hydrolase FAF [Glarea lozoyensis 74030]
MYFQSQRLAETSLDFLDLEAFVKSWGALLIQHKCIEVIGQPESLDPVVQGLINLLYCAASFGKASKKTLACRWEGQILSPEAKKAFRAFYGGQLVQQVKSKECPHISERLEQFSAIQCDIKGKTCLQESLQAYVDGEVMEGGELT